MKTKLPFTWRSLAIYAFIIAVIALQIYAMINVETPPVSFKDEIIPGEYSICRGSALHYKNTFVINHKSPVVYIRSVAKGFVTNPDVPHVTVQQDDKPLYFNVWEPQERVNTLVYNKRGELDYGNSGGWDDEYYDNESAYKFGAQDDAFYAINEQLMIDLAAYVKGYATA